MAVIDILAQIGDNQDFILEIPAGNVNNIPTDILIESDGSLMCTEITGTNGDGNIFIMSE